MGGKKGFKTEWEGCEDVGRGRGMGGKEDKKDRL